MKMYKSLVLTVLIIVIIIIPKITEAQNPPLLPVLGVQYTYDLNGDRTQRQYTQVLMKRGVEEDSAQVEVTITADNKITVAPNPTTGILKVDITGKLSADFQNKITMVDIKGAPLLEMDIKQNSFTLDIGSYVNGHYFMLVNLNGRSQLFKVIKEN